MTAAGLTAPLRVAGLGAGYFSRFHYDAWQRLDRAELVGVADRDLTKAKAVGAAAFSDAAAMLAELQPDLVDIVTPPDTHLDMIALALDAGAKAIICQKPFCGSLAQAKRGQALAAGAGVPLVVHENFRFQPWHREAHRLLRAGALGEPYQISFRLRPGDGQGPRAYLDRQPYFQAMERFLVHETAIHLIDTFRYLMGEVSEVTAWLKRLNPAIAGEDAGFILLDFTAGGRGLFDGNRLVDHPADNRRLTMGEMLIEGAEAVLRLDGDGRLFLRAHGVKDEQDVAYRWQDRGFGGDCVYAFQRHVVDHLLGRGPLVNSGRDYLANLRVEQAVYESDRLGNRVKLKDDAAEGRR